MKVGDYVRTKKYGIKKILDIGEYLGMTQYLIDEYGTYTIDSSIIKSSPNIIDLIEVGDYVNGFEVLRIDKECDLYPTTLKCQYPNHIYYFDIFNEDIKSIVTKEQFESIKYEVE